MIIKSLLKVSLTYPEIMFYQLILAFLNSFKFTQKIIYCQIKVILVFGAMLNC